MSKTYWKDRQDDLWKLLEKDETVLIKNLNEYYEQQFKVLEKEIASYFSMYGKDNVIEYRNLLVGLSREDKKLLYEKHTKFMEKYPQYSHLLPIRESIYKLDRLQGLNYAILSHQVDMGIKEENEIRKHLEKVYGRAYAEINKEFNIIDREGAKFLLNQKWANGDNFSSSIWKNKEKLTNYLTNDFRDGIIRGDNYNKLVKQMRERFIGRSKSDIKRLIFTEGTHINNQAMMKPFADSGLYDKYEYVAVLDGKTSQVCRDLDGQEFKIKDQEPGVNFPPMHPYCRSTFNIVIPEE